MSTPAENLYPELEARAQQPGSYPELEATAAQDPAAEYSELTARASGATIPVAPSGAGNSSTLFSRMPTWEQDWMTHGNPVDQFVQGAFDRAITSTAGAIGGGLKGLWDIAMGNGQTAPADVQQVEQGAAYKPQTGAQAAGAATASSNWNPLNWPGIAISKTGQFLGDTAERMGAPPSISTALDVAPAAAAMLYGPVRDVATREPYTVEAENVGAPATNGAAVPGANPQSISAASVGQGALPQGAPEPDGPPIEGGYSPEAQAERAAILQRVGITQARESAVEGNAKDAASDVLMSKYDQPAGRAAAAQFEAERNALASHAESIIGETGGTVGMDEDALANRGATIARPFDQLREYFDANTRRLYAEADQRAAGTPLTNLDNVDALLQNPSFRNTLLARDQGSLLSAVGNQLEQFRAGNPNGFTAAGAEQVRQWLNQVWTPDNKWAVGQLKDAIDTDVTKTAGEDIYQAARAQRQLKAQTLDNPKGIATLFDTDPNTPINRTTPFERIPDKLTQLPLDQFTNVVQTLKGMPDELQPDAQAALGEIRGHLANKLLQAGTQTAA